MHHYDVRPVTTGTTQRNAVARKNIILRHKRWRFARNSRIRVTSGEVPEDACQHAWAWHVSAEESISCGTPNNTPCFTEFQLFE